MVMVYLTQVKRRAFVTKIQVCVGTPIRFWLGTFETFVVLVVLFPMPYLDDEGHLCLLSCQEGAKLRL